MKIAKEDLIKIIREELEEMISPRMPVGTSGLQA